MFYLSLSFVKFGGSYKGAPHIPIEILETMVLMYLSIITSVFCWIIQLRVNCNFLSIQVILLSSVPTTSR